MMADITYTTPLEDWIDQADLRNFIEKHLKVHLKIYGVPEEDWDGLIRVIMLSLRQELNRDEPKRVTRMEDGLLVTDIIFFGRSVKLVCDGKCNKAWGIHNRPRIQYEEEDDFAWKSDKEIPSWAPVDPKTYEGGHAKPTDKKHNKWCTRECERSKIIDKEGEVYDKDFSKRRYNQPWKHEETK